VGRTPPRLKETNIRASSEQGCANFASSETACSRYSLARAIEFTRTHKLPALIELRYDGNLITPNATLDTIRHNAQAAQAG